MAKIDNKFVAADMNKKEKMEWIETLDKMNEYREAEKGGLRAKMVSKIKQNPFVPIGLIATTIALSVGVYQMRTGNKKRSQLMMRARVFAQGFTVAALLIGIVVASKTKSKKD